MVIRRKLYPCVLAMLCSPASANVCLDMDWLVLNHTVEKTVHYSPSSPVKTRSPHYSNGPLIRDAEGWVKLKATIDNDGTIKEAVIIDSNAPTVLENASINALEKWQYTPVDIEDNDNVQANAIIEFDFKKIRVVPWVAKAFDYRYQNINSDIEKGELDEIPERIALLESLTERYEYHSSLLVYDALVNHLYSRYHHALGDDLRRQVYLEYAYNAISHIDFEIRDMLAHELMLASADVGAFQTVKNTYRETFFGTHSDYSDKAKALYDRVKTVEKSESQLSRKVWVNKLGVGYHTLNMKHFSFSHSDAPIAKVLVSCGDRVTDLEIERGQVATIPSTWGQCLVTVEGQPDTELSITEYESNPFALSSS